MTAVKRIWITGATLWRLAKKMLLAQITISLRRLPVQAITKHRRAVAVAISIGLHALFILCLIPSSKAGFTIGGQGGTLQGEGEGLSLDLSTMVSPDDLAIELREPEAETLAALDSLETLDDLTDQAVFHPLSESVSMAPILQETKQVADPSGSVQASSVRQGGEGQGGTSSGTLDDLWAAIAPCWRRIADDDTLPVNLSVTFASNGMLAKPPEILRNAEGASNAKVLRSESLAITALAECGAYDMAAGRENVSIHFPTP